MNPNDFPNDVRPHLIPSPSGSLVYRCLGCREEFDIGRLLYVCPSCGHVLLIEDKDADRLKALEAATWHRLFDYRKMLRIPALKGVYRYHEFIGPVLPLDDIVYLGEGHTPMVEVSPSLQETLGLRFFFKNDGQNPSASFKDRGMASAFSYLHYLLRSGTVDRLLAVCASTGDTSAAAALYASYLAPAIQSAVLLPHGKVTPQQLAQPLGNGARVFEIPGVFDDCMKVVEVLSERFDVALLNSKNAWRILGQESYAYEIAQDLGYDLGETVVVVPIGNAGNITAVMNGFLKFRSAGIIDRLPKIIGVQSDHANPVYRYYRQKPSLRGSFQPVSVKPSVAQAAMIGNPVSMPRVMHLVRHYDELAGSQHVFFASVSEQDIMDCQLLANRNGNVVCTHGGECLAGLLAARERGWVGAGETAVLDSTAHALKFSGFQTMYFEKRIPPEYEIVPNPNRINLPTLVRPDRVQRYPAPGKPLGPADLESFVEAVADEIAKDLDLQAR